VALLKYRGPDDRLLRVLDRLEAASPPEVLALILLLDARGFASNRRHAAAWEFMDKPELRDPRLPRRPPLPKLDVSLCLPEDFFLTFGPDAIEVYHLLRWCFFLTEPDLQRAMLDACQGLGQLFGAVDCVVTSDFSPVVQAFRAGSGYDASLAAAGPEDGERPTIADLYWETPEDYLLREVAGPDGRTTTRYRDWGRDKPPPDGWQRASTWDSRGYWRFPLDPTPHPELAEPASDRGLLVPPVMDEARWLTGSEPGEMLDHLLRQDGVSWRKVRLWGCACVRRVWPRLATQTSRRAVEVVEEFVDGRATQQAVDGAVRAAASVKKGDRRANHAAYLVGRLCSESDRFPPADVADAVADVVARERSGSFDAGRREGSAGGPGPVHLR
jgi:hypothetical protein